MRKLLVFGFAFLFLSPFSYSQWNPNPAINTGVCLQANDQQDVRIVTDSKGGAIITWLDFRMDATQFVGDIYVQRVDKTGMVKWTVNGVSLCNLTTDQTAPSLVEDGTGGAIIAWNDWRNGNRDIYAQRIDSTGTIQWTPNGVPVVVKANHQQDAKLISDGLGGAIIVWQDSASGSYDIFAQRLSNTGAALWASTGVAVCNAVFTQINPRIEVDGSGGAIVTWQDKRNAADYDIYAQRINASGAVQWTANGVAICTAAGTQSNPKIEPDGAGGAYIGWQDKRNGTNYDIYAQRVNASGAPQWNTNGSVVSAEPGNQSALDMTSEGVAGVIFTWKDDRNGNFDIYFQRADAAGVMQFAAGGNSTFLLANDQINPNIVGDGSGGAIIAFQDSSTGTWDITSQRISASGTLVWTLAGVAVGTAAGNQTGVKSVSDGMGGCIYAFQDKRNTIDFDIYAHHLYSNGSPSGVLEHTQLIGSIVYPNPFSESAFLRIISSNKAAADYQLLVFDILGNKVPVDVTVQADGFLIRSTGLQLGIYFYEIRTGHTSLSQGKLILTN